MKPIVVAIAGGTGSGKTTLANMLAQREPDCYALVRFDDYYKHRDELTPDADGHYNWDHPDALRFEVVTRDLKELCAGHSIVVHTREWKYNAEHEKVYEEHFDRTIDPHPVILVEGFLALYDAEIRSLMDLKFYLDIPIEESLKRRLKMENKFNNERYFRDILIPAHTEFVEPTRAYADVIVDVRSKSAEEVYQEVHARIEEELQENPHHESA